MDKISFQYLKERIKESIFAILILTLLFGAMIYAIVSGNSRVLKSEIVIGELVNFHQMQGHDGAIDSVFIIKLGDDSTVRVSPPSHTPIKINHKIELEKREKQSGRVQYIFKRYHDDS